MRITLRVSEELHRQLKEYAAARNTTMSTLLKDHINSLVSNKQPVEKEKIDKADKTPLNTSNQDEVPAKQIEPNRVSNKIGFAKVEKIEPQSNTPLTPEEALHRLQALQNKRI